MLRRTLRPSVIAVFALLVCSAAPSGAAVPPDAAPPGLPATEGAQDIETLSLEALLNEEVTTATRSAMRLDEAPGSVTVITRDDIRDMNARTLREVLNAFIPGMDVVPAYFRYGDRVNEGIYSRGLLSDFSQQVLVIWNGGAKFNETSFGTPFPAVEFTLENVERVEVSRSPVPLYGGGAFTIINIITREQSMEGAEVSVDLSAIPGAGDPASELVGGRKASATMGRTVNGWHLGGSIQFYQDRGQAHPDSKGAGGFRSDVYGATLRDGTRYASNVTLSVKSPGDKLTLQAWYKDTNRDAFLSGLVPSQASDTYTYHGRTFIAQAVYWPVPKLHVSVGAMTAYWRNFIDFAGTPFGGDESNFDLFADVNYSLQFSALGSHTLLAGAKVEWEGQYDSSISTWDMRAWIRTHDQTMVFAPDDDRRVGGVYLEDAWRPIERLTILLGGRADYYDGFAGRSELVASPRAALVTEVAKGFTLKALYASATRPPSIYERSGKALVPLYGDANVDSERVHTVEVAGIFRRGSLRIQLTPFLQIFSDKIEYVDKTTDPAAPRFVAQNNGRTTSAGADLEATYYLDSRTYGYVKGSLFDSQDRAAQRRTFFIPEQYASAGVNVNQSGFNLNLNGYLRGKRHLDAVALPVNAVEAGGPHAMLNASLAYEWARAARLYVLVENLIDTRNNVPLAVDGLYVPMRGLTVHLGLTFTLDALASGPR
jgi:outer membrane receptor for ferrienterochelin and colicins